jgi:hypothetical protein
MKFLKQFDRYAQRLEINLAGKSSQQSTFGGLVSLLSYILVLAYGSFLFRRLILRGDPLITTFEVIKDLD